MSSERNTRLITNIGTLVTGDLNHPVRQADSVSIADGLIRAMGSGLPHQAEVVIDALGLTAMPGLIDSHSHLTFGEFTPSEDLAAIVAETELFLESCSSGNLRMALRLLDLVKALRAFHLADVEKTVQRLRALLAGEEVAFERDGFDTLVWRGRR